MRYHKVHVVEGDGTLGLQSAAPFDAIVVTAEGPSIPRALREQLKEGGRIVMPVGTPAQQTLIRLTAGAGEEDKDRIEELGPVLFVPLIGAQGWPAQSRLS